MTTRFTDVVFSEEVAANDSVQFGLAIPQNICDIAKIKMEQSETDTGCEFYIYKAPTFLAADLIYATREFQGSLVDPVLDDGTNVIEVNQGHVVAYEDTTEASQIYIKIVNTHLTKSVTYTGTITLDTLPGSSGGAGEVVGVPENLVATAFAVNLDITSRVTVGKNGATIDQAEVRFLYIGSSTDLLQYDLRTVAEGGTFDPVGNPYCVRAVVSAVPGSGAIYAFTSTWAGRWYYAWRVHNDYGWSKWTDGNTTPSRVTQSVDTTTATGAITGPPEDWEVWIEDGPSSNTIVVHATRPQTNGAYINFFGAIIKDGDTGAWQNLVDGSTPTDIHLDGSTRSYSLDPLGNIIYDDTLFGWGSAANGDMVGIDVRGGGNFDEEYMQWALVDYVSGDEMHLHGFITPQAYTDLRIIVIKPVYCWTSNGYLGNYPGGGSWPVTQTDANKYASDTKSTEFVTTPIVIPAGITNPEALVWFGNGYSRWHDGLNHSTGKLGLPGVKTFTLFNDTGWFIPLHASPLWADVTWSSSKPTIAAVTPRTSSRTPGQFYGIKGHFAVFPDLSGIIKLRAKFENVTLPAYTGTDPLVEGTYFFLGFCDKSAEHSTWGVFGTFFGNYRDEPLLQLIGGSGTSLFGNPARTGDPTYYPTVCNWYEFARPASGYYFEIKLGFYSAAVDPKYSLTTCEVSINGAGFVAPTGAAYGLQDMADISMEGLTPMIGVYEAFHNADSQNLPDFSAQITELEVMNGIIARYRISSSL